MKIFVVIFLLFWTNLCYAKDRYALNYKLIYCEKSNETLYAFKELHHSPIIIKKHNLCQNRLYKNGIVKGYTEVASFFKSSSGDIFVICDVGISARTDDLNRSVCNKDTKF